MLTDPFPQCLMTLLWSIELWEEASRNLCLKFHLPWKLHFLFLTKTSVLLLGLTMRVWAICYAADMLKQLFNSSSLWNSITAAHFITLEPFSGLWSFMKCRYFSWKNLSFGLCHQKEKSLTERLFFFLLLIWETNLGQFAFRKIKQKTLPQSQF